ncbi:MAG TPA: M1 family aminopeptidase [Candidatus Acidoferrales bacterium]|nr:M1 family aminopeptidase [Candidatus Acidoferrales bacterium]
MITKFIKVRKPEFGRSGRRFLATAVSLLSAIVSARADEPYARTRTYDLQHSRIILRFDVDQKKVIGEVIHTVSTLRGDTSKIEFDSVGLTIQSVTVNKAPAKFETTAAKLVVPVSAGKVGDKFDIDIRYEGKPTKGLYFILPDKDYPNRPTQIWTQGESEDTRYYLPTYDYPNDRLTTETVLTVPASWLTVSNGKLVGVTNAANNMKTWTWRESVASSTYLITVVAGEFDEVKDSLRNLPVTYYAPKGRGDRLPINYSRTPAMIELFNKKYGVDYPWEKYAQVMVDDFVAGGMENSSATTNTSSSLVNPKLAAEFATGQDDLISHELTHQWFGDYVTCKDWGNIWLNEGFATFGETVWTENHFPKDQSEYQRWTDARHWFASSNLYSKPIVRYDFDDSSEFDGNAYGKGGWVLYMLRHQLGEEAFNRGIKHYLEVNHGRNVVTADLVKAVEESTNTDVDQFFNQWVYGAGAPKLDISYAYDNSKNQVALTVKQTQKVQGYVGVFRVPAEVEITTDAGAHLYPIVVSKPTETFSLPASSEPLMVLFDKGGHILKKADFHKEKKEWLYQLKNAADFSDRADTAVALRSLKDDAAHADGKTEAKNDDVIAALADAAGNDKAWGVRAVAAESLGEIGGPVAAKKLIAALDSAKEPWLRARMVAALGNLKDDKDVLAKLQNVAEHDSSYRARATALQALGKLKAPNAFAILNAAIAEDSPDDFLRNAALRSLGPLGDEKAVPVLREWVVPGKTMETRQAAIFSLARLQKDNKEITTQIASYLPEKHFEIRMAAVSALGARGDASAIPALEQLLKSDDLSIEVAPMVKEQIAHLKRPAKGKGGGHATAASADDDDDEASGDSNSGGNGNTAVVAERLDKLEHLIQEMNDRLKTIETRLPAEKH